MLTAKPNTIRDDKRKVTSVIKNSPGCDSLQISASSFHSNFATSSGVSTAHHSTVPQRASCSFDGIDPNGSDAKLGRPAKQQRLR